MPDDAIDYRSDLLARPTAAIKAAVLAALEAAPAFGLREDARQRELEARVAELLGKQDSLFFPTCSMANEAALAVHCRPGDAVVTEAQTHIVTSEAGAPGGIAGAIVLGLPGRNGLPDAATVGAQIAAGADPSRPRVAALALENTHLRSGGRVLDAEAAAALYALCREAGVAVHLDGARLFNAAVASGSSLTELAGIADSVALSLNKGLGAPYGAMLAGSKAFIAEALRVRHRLGGGVRPTAMTAAAALAALASWEHIAADHRRARELAAGLAALPGLSVPEAETNIVFVDLTEGTAAALVQALSERGVRVLPYGPGRIRLVTHRSIDDAALARTLEAFRAVVKS
jgi:threonine aldolase